MHPLMITILLLVIIITIVIKVTSLAHHTDGLAVWYFKHDLNDFGYYKYPEEISQQIETAFVTGKRSIIIDDENKIIFDYGIISPAFTQVSLKSGKSKQVMRHGGPIMNDDGTFCWSYQTKSGSWIKFDDEISSNIEKEFTDISKPEGFKFTTSVITNSRKIDTFVILFNRKFDDKWEPMMMDISNAKHIKIMRTGEFPSSRVSLLEQFGYKGSGIDCHTLAQILQKGK